MCNDCLVKHSTTCKQKKVYDSIGTSSAPSFIFAALTFSKMQLNNNQASAIDLTLLRITKEQEEKESVQLVVASEKCVGFFS